MNKLLKKYSIVTVTATVLFIAFVAFTAGTVNNFTSLVEQSGLSSHNGVPATWNDKDALAGLSSETFTENKGGYLQYTTVVRNTNTGRDATLTHVASYYSEPSNSGFVPFNTSGLEYSYSPNTKGSWNKVSVSAPSPDETGFKLGTEINLTSSENEHNVVYFRYIVSPDQEGTIIDKVSFLAKNAQGQKGVIVSDQASISYERPNSVEVLALSGKSLSEDPSGESTFAEPLGVMSDTSSTDVISATALGSFSLSSETTNRNIIIVVAIVCGFAACLIAYLIIRTRANAKKKKH